MIVAAEKGKIHTMLSMCLCIWSGSVLPPLMVYLCKQPVPEKLKDGAIPKTIFLVSDSDWINSQLYLEWFKIFIQNVPPTRPVLLPVMWRTLSISVYTKKDK